MAKKVDWSIIDKTYKEIKYDEDKRLKFFYNPAEKHVEFTITIEGIKEEEEDVYPFWLNFKQVDELINYLNLIKETTKDYRSYKRKC